MTGTRIDYGDLEALVDDARKDRRERGERPRRVRRALRRLLLWAAALVVLATLPFVVLVRTGVHAYQAWGLGSWTALGLGTLATALLLGLYAWLAGRRLGAGPGARRLLRRGAVGLAVAFVGYALVYLGGANAKGEEVRAEYRQLHPLLRVAASSLFLVDPGAVITDASRTREDYFLMGLPVNEASLHFAQEDGFVHALDLRTRGRKEWANRAMELAFWGLGFHSLRHVGTADHLHVSLRLPD